MTAPAPSLDAILGARTPVIVPGLLHWLGLDQPDDEPETYEQFCERLSKGEK